jgi:hypothetical protein
MPHGTPGTIVRAPEPQPVAPVAPTMAHGKPARAPRPVVGIAVQPSRQRRGAVAAQDDTIFGTAAPEGFAIVHALAPPPPILVETIEAPESSEPAHLAIAPLRLAPLEVDAITDTPRERQE